MTASRKRKRRVTKKLGDEMMDPQEERLLHLVLARSKMETQRRESTQVPAARVFRPTKEEFTDPIKYIRSIREEARKTGICKVIPPTEWAPRVAIDLNDDTTQFETRLQRINRLQEGKCYEDGKKHTFRSYRAGADEFRRSWCKKKGWDPVHVTSEEIEKEYWRIVETNPECVQVEYANDLDTTAVGSGFERAASIASMFDDPLGTHIGAKHTLDFDAKDYYKKCGWNLNNIPQCQGSLLRHIRTPINGVNVPWLYCGMLFATFCWHTEDNYLYSINYMHYGAKKRWYGIPAHDASNFEKVLKKNVPLRMHENPDLLFHLVTMLSPSILQSNNVSVYSLVQEPGEIVITFPKAYHSGYSEGFNCNEAVNFALPDWIGFSTDCAEHYRKHGRLSVFSPDRLMCQLADHLEDHDEESLDLLLHEFRLILDEETLMRKEMRANGMFNIVEMPANGTYIDGRAMKNDDARQCTACKHSCFFSAIACNCNARHVSCLRHANDLCKCESSEKCLLVWVTLKEIRQLIDKVESHKLKMSVR